MKLGIEFLPNDPIKEIGKLGQEVEKSEFNQIWVSDHYHNRFVHSVLVYLALKTKKINLGPGVTNPYLIHPTVTAAATATLDEVSNGRAVLGISAGDPFFLQSVGMKHSKPITMVREAIEVIRKLLTGERIDYSGDVFTCKGAKLKFSPSRNIPIYIGGRKKQMLKLSGSHADGALLNTSHPDDIKECIQYIRDGAKDAGRNLDDFNVVAYAATSIGSDEEKAREKAKTVTAFVASSAPESTYERENIEKDKIEEIRKYLKSGDIGRARDFVTEKMIDVFSISGSIENLEDRISELEKLGVDQIVIGSPIGPDSNNVIKRIGNIGI